MKLKWSRNEHGDWIADDWRIEKVWSVDPVR